MENGQMFARLIEEYGSLEKQEEEQEQATIDDTQKTLVAAKRKDYKTVATEPAQNLKTKGLMQDEERAIGAVSWQVYAKYFRFSGGIIIFPLVLLWVVLSQGAQVSNSLFLGFWTSSSIHEFTQGDYMGTYAALGVASGIFSFALSFTVRYASCCMALILTYGTDPRICCGAVS